MKGAPNENFAWMCLIYSSYLFVPFVSFITFFSSYLSLLSHFVAIVHYLICNILFGLFVFVSFVSYDNLSRLFVSFICQIYRFLLSRLLHWFESFRLICPLSHVSVLFCLCPLLHLAHLSLCFIHRNKWAKYLFICFVSVVFFPFMSLPHVFVSCVYLSHFVFCLICLTFSHLSNFFFFFVSFSLCFSLSFQSHLYFFLS